MATELRITDRCPACGQGVMIALSSVAPTDGPYVGLTVLVDPAAARLHDADPAADHPCPGPPGTTDPAPVEGAVPEDHSS